MRKRIFFPLFILFVFFPLIIYLLSYTRLFNDEVRTILTTLVDDGTNARLHMGQIQGSIFGTFRIDGAALLYHGEPIAMVDTVQISHLPLSLITKTIQVMNVELINPRFYLVRYRDGSFNVDHIGKPSGRQGGKFDWTILARSVNIRGGQFTLYDSTVNRLVTHSLSDVPEAPLRRFDPTDFTVKDLDIRASASLSGDNLSVNMNNMSMRVDQPGLEIDSLRFGFFTSPGGTEVSGFRLRTGRTMIHIDLTLARQDLLDAFTVNTIRDKYFTANIQASNTDLRQVEGFVPLPIDSPSRFALSMFVSGTLDTFSVKQCLLRTDSSVIPLSGTFQDVLDSTLSMNISVSHADLDMAELADAMRKLGFPDFSQLRKMSLDATVNGEPQNLSVAVLLSNPKTEISGQSQIGREGYDGGIAFKGLNVAELLNLNSLNTALNGEATFSLRNTRGSIPDGVVSVRIDSSHYDHIAILKATVKVVSADDSVGANIDLSTSKGSVEGDAGLGVATSSYAGSFVFDGLDIAPFAHVPVLEGNLTGRLQIGGRGFDIDSMYSQVSLLTERSTLGSFRLDSALFTVNMNTELPEKALQIHSPYFDASVHGDFVPHRLPGQLAMLFTSLADSFSAKFTGRLDTTRSGPDVLPGLDADVDVDVKDGRILGQLLENTELSGNGSAHFHIASTEDSILISGYLSADTLDYRRDSLTINAGEVNVGFNYRSNPELSVWDSGRWSTEGAVGSFAIGSTRLAAEAISVNYAPGDSSTLPKLSLAVQGEVDTLVEFGINATANVTGNEFSFVADTLNGRFYGVPLVSESPVFIRYSPEVFHISPATFSTRLPTSNEDSQSTVTVIGSYSLEEGANFHFGFEHFALREIQGIARLDTNRLNLKGSVSGQADLKNNNGGMLLALGFSGNNIEYNGSISKVVEGRLNLNGQVMAIDAQLSGENDSSHYALKLNGKVPLSAESPEQLRVDISADSLNVSFLTPFLSGIEDFGGTVSGNMSVSGKYLSPEMKGTLVLDDGRIRLAANKVDYLFNGTIKGEGNKLLLSPLVIRDVPGQEGGTITANGSITIGQNTIQKFNLVFDGSLLVLNSTSRRTLQGIYGSAIVGSGKQGLRLEGSLERPMLLGTLNIRSADMTLLPLEKKEDLASQNIIYHFPVVTSKKNSSKDSLGASVVPPVASSGSFIDSLRYDVEVETKDNVNFRMIFDPTTNEELYAVLGGHLHLSNLSGEMELTGDVSVQNNSYYNFYGRHFAASGKLSFTGDPLNPLMDITAQYQGDYYADTSSTKAQTVVVQLSITGSFNHPNAPAITLTKDNVPFQGDAQTNAISFILFNRFESDVTQTQKQNVANTLMSEAGAGVIGSIGTSILSGIATNFLSREFSFIRSAELRASSISSLSNPDVAITAQFQRATIKVGGQVFSDISNTDLSVDYPLADLLGNMLYLQLSRKVALNNRTYFQRETVNALRLFYRLSF